MILNLILETIGDYIVEESNAMIISKHNGGVLLYDQLKELFLNLLLP